MPSTLFAEPHPFTVNQPNFRLAVVFWQLEIAQGASVFVHVRHVPNYLHLSTFAGSLDQTGAGIG